MENDRKTYMTIAQACNYTGLSQHYLRAGCRANTIPHIMCGSKYMVNIPVLLEHLEAEARRNGMWTEQAQV